MAGADFLVTKPGCSTKSGCITPTSNTQRSCRGNHSDSPSMRVQVRKNSSYERLGKTCIYFLLNHKKLFSGPHHHHVLQNDHNCHQMPAVVHSATGALLLLLGCMRRCNLRSDMWKLWVQKLGPPFINDLTLDHCKIMEQ